MNKLATIVRKTTFTIEDAPTQKGTRIRFKFPNGTEKVNLSIKHPDKIVEILNLAVDLSDYERLVLSGYLESAFEEP